MTPRSEFAFQSALLEALGLKGRSIARLTLTVEAMKVSRIVFEEYVIGPGAPAPGERVTRVLELATWTERAADDAPSLSAALGEQPAVDLHGCLDTRDAKAVQAELRASRERAAHSQDPQ